MSALPMVQVWAKVGEAIRRRAGVTRRGPERSFLGRGEAIEVGWKVGARMRSVRGGGRARGHRRRGARSEPVEARYGVV